MKTTNDKIHLTVLAGIIVLAAISRLIPHPPNFTPIAAMALFGGAYFSKRSYAFIVPLIAMLISDMLIMRFVYAHISTIPEYFISSATISVYISFALIVLIGMMLRNNVRPLPIIGAALSSSVLFFLITNFAVWSGSTYYPQNLPGLIACYGAAIPFYRGEIFGSFFFNTVMGDLFFVAVLFGSFEVAKYRFPVLAKV
ncbi:MAG: hypothetical protein IIA88_05385 [Bacteroidetes bacterium]|nr:hypothetical protein [Bacteroidota bacterium]